MLTCTPVLIAIGATVDINTADARTLDRVLIGVGPAKAEAIVEYRKSNGPFGSADDLVKVPGIGPSTLEKNRARIRVNESGARFGADQAPAPRPPSSPASRPMIYRRAPPPQPW
jgi:competence protein ComEA